MESDRKRRRNPAFNRTRRNPLLPRGSVGSDGPVDASVVVRMNTDFRLDHLPCYLRAIFAVADHDLDAARAAIRECLAECRTAGATDDLSSMLQMLGGVEAEAGNRAAFERHYAEAIALEPNSPLPRLFFAHALFHSFKDASAARRELAQTDLVLPAPEYPSEHAERARAMIEDVIKKLQDELSKADEP